MDILRGDTEQLKTDLYMPQSGTREEESKLRNPGIGKVKGTYSDIFVVRKGKHINEMK